VLGKKGKKKKAGCGVKLLCQFQSFLLSLNIKYEQDIWLLGKAIAKKGS